MNIYIALTFLIAISALFSYINHRFIKMPFVIGLFFLSTLLSLAVLSAKFWFKDPYLELRHIVEEAHISEFILNILLGFLLFAGSLHTSWFKVKKQLKPISIFAIGGVILSTIIIAFLMQQVCFLFQIQIPFIYCLLFGALISPTDPIAVLGILTKAKVPEKIETTIVGESLFNDGIGVVIFIALLETLHSGTSDFDFLHFGKLFLQESVGGVLFGLCFGLILHRLLKSINHYATEVLLTIAFVMVGYNVCLYFHLSGALAMVVMGLLVGNYKQSLAMSDNTMEYINKFWELVDVILNAILFILIAFVMVVIDFKINLILIGLISVFIVLFARAIIVLLPNFILPKNIQFSFKESKLIIWGGLRGGLSLALVLSLPEGEPKNILLLATYICVLFSILVQGLTIEKMAKKLTS